MKLLFAIVVLILAAYACGFNIDLPEVATPGPAITEPITVTAPDAEEAHLMLEFGAGDLKIGPGAVDNTLVEGTATYNVEDFKPGIDIDQERVRIEQGDYQFKSVPDLSDMKNEWDLKLGVQPMDLTIAAGAYKATYELGGLSLTGLSIKEGAARTELSFDSPNPVVMNLMRYETGASNVKISGLANANLNTLIFESGAGDYTLDFSGDLQRDASISIETGLSNLTLIIPADLAAELTIEGTLTNVNIDSDWSKNGDYYSKEGNSPTLTIVVQMSAGKLTITD
jgi:hypothetical protein